MPGYESIMICGRAPDGLPRVLSLDNDGYIPGIGTHRYYTKILSYGPIAYWPLWDTVPPTAEELVNSPAQDGTHVNVTLGQPGIGDGGTSCLYDGATSGTNVYSVSLRNAFNGMMGTVVVWGQISGAGIWNDGNFRMACHFGADLNNLVQIDKGTMLNQIRFYYRAGGVWRGVADTSLAGSLAFFQLGITWDKNAGGTGEVRAYINGSQVGVTQVNLGVWAGVLAANRTNIGATTAPPTVVWDGCIAHVAVFNRALSPAEIADLGVV